MSEHDAHKLFLLESIKWWFPAMVVVKERDIDNIGKYNNWLLYFVDSTGGIRSV
jgi:hypothetical protein